MRLEIFDKKAKLSAKIIAQIVRYLDGFSPDIVKMFLYRGDFFGSRFQPQFHEVMRGSSEWSAGERELMAAFVSAKNKCRYCADVHRATAGRLVGDEKASAVMTAPETAPISDKLRAMLGFLEKLTLNPKGVRPEDIAELRRAGISEDGIANGVEVCVQFSIVNRLADTFAFRLQTPKGLANQAKALATKHYKY